MKYFLKINLIILVFCLQSVNSSGTDKNKVIGKYYKVHKKFRRSFCKPGTEEKFWDLFKEFRGDGYHIPLLHDKSLDFDAINKNLESLFKKVEWIENLRKKIPSSKAMKKLRKSIKSMEKTLNALLKYKHDFHETEDGKYKLQNITKSKLEFVKLKEKFKILIARVQFLQGFRYPVDHLVWRKKYNDLKKLKDINSKKKANEIYFYRRIIEDGAQEKNNTGSDLMFRAALNTVTIKLKSDLEFISEELRYDLTYILNKMDHYLKMGNKKWKNRIVEWKNRTKRKYDFYSKLVTNQNDTQRLYIENRANGLNNLKKFVYEKQAGVYKFWTEQDFMMRKLFVLETILFNEVGRVDGREALERKDVSQVVINRTTMDEYSLLNDEDDIVKFLDKNIEKEVDIYRWLNTFFKEGEFSFTYYFISGNVRVFCPSMTRASRYLRRQNLRIALNMLNSPNNSFEAVRYFSRASMVGRINMDSVWNNFNLIPERPGALSNRNRYLKGQYKKNKYSYLYHFKDTLGKTYKAVEIMGHKYVHPKGFFKFYKYRSPHLFKYFSPKKEIITIE